MILVHPDSLTHMLVINVADTDALQPLPESDGDGEWPSADESQSERYQAFLQHLRGLTYTDGKLYEPIDMIRIDCTSYDMPGKNLWTALDGLQPKHLHIECGFDEECDLEPLDMLQRKWGLETLFLAGLTDNTELPSIFCGLKALTMTLCFNVDFNPPGQLHALRHLTIIGNDNLDMFTALCRSNPAVPGLLQTLDLQCDHQMHNHDIDQFKVTLARCTALLSLRLILGGPGDITRFLGIAPLLPSSLEHLTFRCMPTMSGNLRQWLKSAVDPIWVPHLKTISFGLDVSPDTPSPPDAAQMMKISTQVGKFLDILSSHRPNLQILDDF